MPMIRPAADASAFSAIAHPTRRAVLAALRDGERSVTDLRDALTEQVSASSQAGFSEHLAILARADLVSARRQGRQRLYRLNPAPLAEIADWLRAYEPFWDERLERLGHYLDRRREDGA